MSRKNVFCQALLLPCCYFQSKNKILGEIFVFNPISRYFIFVFNQSSRYFIKQRSLFGIIFTISENHEKFVEKVDFCCTISLSGSGFGFQIRIRIQSGNLNPDPTGSGSETLDLNAKTYKKNSPNL